MSRQLIFSYYSVGYIIAVFILAYLHRRLDMFSSALIMIGALLLYIPIVIIQVRKMMYGNQPIIEGLRAIYAPGLFITAATLFIPGKDHLAQAGEPIIAVWFLTAAFVAWRLYRIEKKNLGKRNTRVLLSTAAPALLAVLSFIVLNYR